MKIALITRGKKRHVWLAEKLQYHGLLGQHFVQDHITETESNSEQSDMMAKYFNRVSEYENNIFRTKNSVLEVKFKDFMTVCDAITKSSDTIPIVFGCSIIKDTPLRVLAAAGAMNVHAGISPEYRGSACNFWAMYDDRPDLVGVTLHKLTNVIDDGEIYYQISGVQGGFEYKDPIKYSMDALKYGLQSIVLFLNSFSDYKSFLIHKNKIINIKVGDRKNIRVSRHRDFDEVSLLSFCNRLNVSC